MSGLFQVYFSPVLFIIYHNEMFNAGCLIPTFCNCQEGTLQWGWSTFHSSCYFCGGEGRHTWRLDFVSPVHCLCSHQEWSFHSGMPMPISGNRRKGVWLSQNLILFSIETSVVSLPHPQKSSTDNSFIYFFFVYLIMTQPCFLKPTLQLWVLNPDRTCHQSLDCIFILCWWAGMGNSSYAREDLLFAVTDTIGCFGHPSLPCLFTVEVT